MKFISAVFALFALNAIFGAAHAQPTITQQPTDQTVTNGATVVFSVLVSGIGPFSYQWQCNGTNLPPIITTVAGNGTGSYSGDGGPATNAGMTASSIAVDAAGNLFIADAANSRIRKVDQTGLITTVAGNGTNGYSGNGEMATNAELNGPSGVAVDTAGNLFIADLVNQRIRKVNAHGIISTIAGGGVNVPGNGLPATNAKLALSIPSNIAVDDSSNLFIPDTFNYYIQEVPVTGIMTTVAGTGAASYIFYGDGELATLASLSDSYGVAANNAHSLFIADSGNNQIHQVDTNGIIWTIAGTGTGGCSGDGGLALDAELYNPDGVAVDSSGTLFIADTFNNRVRKVCTNGVITTIAGNGPSWPNSGGYSGDGGIAAQAMLSFPTSVAVDSFGNLFIADNGNSRVRKVAQGPTFFIGDVTTNDIGNYVVIITSPSGTVTSSIASLNIPAFIETQPQARTALAGGFASFNITANGTMPILYQWFLNGTNIVGATNSTYAINTVSTNDEGMYSATAGNAYGSASSQGALLTVAYISQQLSNQTTTNGGNAIFDLGLSTNGAFFYQWYFDATSLSWATTNSLALSNVNTNEEGYYFAVVSGYGGSLTSSVVTLTVVPLLLTQQPQNEAQLLGKTAAFNVVVSGPSPLAYQWYFSNPALQTTAKAKAQISSGFVYSVVVTNAGSGYTTLPRVQFIGGSGSGAGGKAAVSSGKVASITLTNAGSGYTTAPAVLIDSPNGLLIGQTNATLNLNAITTNNLGSYFVVISNIYGCLTSSAATLNRAYPPGITRQPQSQFVAAGSGAFFSVTSTGTPPLNFQWWVVSSQLTNATATPLVTNGFVLGATISKGGAGYLAVPAVQFVGGSGSGAGGMATVSNRMVTAINITNAGSGYTTHPTIQIAAPTATALPGQTAFVFSLVAVTGTNAGNYFVVVTNNFGSVTSQVAMLTVELPGFNQITSQLLPNQNLRLSFLGLTGTNYALDRTFNLSPARWVPQATNHANAEGTLVFTNIPDTATNNFWRIREVP